MIELELRQEVLKIGRLLHEKNFVAATDGNISARVSNKSDSGDADRHVQGHVASGRSPFGRSEGRTLAGTREVSTELACICSSTNCAADVNAVVHAHPPTATGFAAAGLALDEPLISEVELSLGRVPLAGYALPGSDRALR